jgi:hypothetical protein
MRADNVRCLRKDKVELKQRNRLGPTRIVKQTNSKYEKKSPG